MYMVDCDLKQKFAFVYNKKENEFNERDPGGSGQIITFTKTDHNW
jgi:hypothetical protein